MAIYEWCFFNCIAKDCIESLIWQAWTQRDMKKKVKNCLEAWKYYLSSENSQKQLFHNWINWIQKENMKLEKRTSTVWWGNSPAIWKMVKKYLSRGQGICAGAVSVYLVHKFFVRPLTSTKKVYQKPTYHSNIFCTFSHFRLLSFFFVLPVSRVQSSKLKLM